MIKVKEKRNRKKETEKDCITNCIILLVIVTRKAVSIESFSL